jgi:hypothetical protein
LVINDFVVLLFALALPVSPPFFLLPLFCFMTMSCRIDLLAFT